MNLENWKYHSSKLPTSDPVEMAKYSEELKKEFADEIRNNPEKYKDFFEGCYHTSIEAFITTYAMIKSHMVTAADYYLNQTKENRILKYKEDTDSIFDLILQKKLFNIQLQWRAETLKIPQVRICRDFMFWEDHIRDCPFLDMVTEAEVEVMKQYLKSDNYSDITQSWLCGWQDADEIREINDEGLNDMYPEWYEFYDGRMGTGALLLLPDVRGAKEEAYMVLLRAENAKKLAMTPPHEHEPFVFVHGDTQTIHSFVHQYEDEYFKAVADGYLNSHVTPNAGFEELDDEVDMAIILLQQADEPIYMPGGLHWKEAIVKCAQQYKNSKIAEELDFVYEEYMMLKGAGIGWVMEDYTEEYRKDHICKMYEDYLIKARIMNGEEGNLNF